MIKGRTRSAHHRSKTAPLSARCRKPCERNPRRNRCRARTRRSGIELRGLGVFSIKQRQARTARNPRTSQRVQRDKRRLPV
ncbi:HU family DNA-binding protein [Bradyrhizobium cenepequi]|uniref:HU family DNA-binding protein n=1 Tax=Bradyrhizobium cenepequi TaxID=2821403 RepID=UPI002899E536|nr:HU family DNA-binding protein [Bradyrhizobium cenepequi]